MTVDVPKILWHYGTCDYCGKRLVNVCHFGYDSQPKRDYRMCVDCITKELELILFGNCFPEKTCEEIKEMNHVKKAMEGLI